MSAELLRRAAKVLRERAGKAQHTEPWCPDYTWSAVRHVQRNCGDMFECGTHGADRNAECFSFDMYDGRYVALMHPPVALALARLLAATGHVIQDFAEVMNDGIERDGDLTEIDQAALDVARAILREAP